MAEFVYQIEKKCPIPNGWAAEWKVPKCGDWMADSEGDLVRCTNGDQYANRKAVVVWRVGETARQMRIREKVEALVCNGRLVERICLRRVDLDNGKDEIWDLVRAIEAELFGGEDAPKSEPEIKFFFGNK